jgi:parallel beta-helix repeat protein
MNPSTGQRTETPSLQTYSGNWFYVGGNGPNNYSKIQNAIDNANDGDTVFVYDDNSPYYENLIINKSIQLYGRNWENTIIDGKNNGEVIIIVHDNVTITNFTIAHSGEFYYNFFDIIRVQSCNNVSITHNFLTSSDYRRSGIVVSNSGISPLKTGIVIQDNIINNTLIGIELDYCYCLIVNNLIENTIEGISAYDESYNNITKNTFKNCSTGILLYYAHENKIYYNNFLNCKTGIELDGNKNTIQWNEFMECIVYGIVEYRGRQNEIHFNNFIKNHISAHFHWVIFDICVNYWNENYWDDHHTILPRSIPGIIQYRDDDFTHWCVPWVQFDWIPAQEPYNIPSMK